MLREGAKADQVELSLAELARGCPAYRRPSGQGERQILSQCHGAEERARLKEHTEKRHTLIEMRLSYAVDVDSTCHWLLQANQVSEQRALAAP
jgi:hypothetical protein